MDRATDQAAPNPSVGTSYLRAALELAGRDQHHAESREARIVALLRARGVPWREIAHHRGLRSAQAAEQRYRRLTATPEIVIYAFRDADEKDAPWHGYPSALPVGQFEVGNIDFNPAMPRPLSGHTLEVRYGPSMPRSCPGICAPTPWSMVAGSLQAPPCSGEPFGG